jgi:penicillin-binding protein 1C
MTAAEALRESRNIPAMLVLARTGVEHVRGVMESAGLKTLGRSPRAYGVSLAVGGADATPMEVATAYAGLARGGTSCGHRFLSDRACRQTLGALADQDRTAGLSRDAARLNVAWKTGTSSDHRDAWCAAVTPRRTVVVWLGNAAGEPSHALVGRDAAAPLALNLIAALDPVPADWPVDGFESKTVAASSPARLHRTRLAIVSPAPKQEILLSKDLPADHQRLSLRSAGSQTGGTIHWFVDGERIGTTHSHAESFWWTPAPGSHEIRAVDATGDAAVTTISVRPG